MASSMTMRSSAAQQQRSAFFGSKTIKVSAPLVARAPRAQVATQALFGFGAKKEAAGAAPSFYICTECGFIYDGDFKTAPASYKCPVCNVPKSKFKVFKGDVKGRPNNGGAAMKKRKEERQW